MFIKNLQELFILNLKNIPGLRTDRKIVVIECDDWGSVRMPSKEVYKALLNSGISVDKGRYTKYDTLADKVDLECLFEILLNIKDKNGNHPVMTPMTVVANPDFQKIKGSDFTQYFYEPFTDTLQRYKRSPETFNTWKKGLDLGIFVPEFHGRDHISVQFWLQKLRDGDNKLKIAFDHEVVSINVDGMNPAVSEFRPEFYFNSPDQVKFLEDAISEGVKVFKSIFKYTPRAFAPANGIFHPVFEAKVAEEGLKYLNVSRFSRIPDKNGNLKLKFNRIGRETTLGLTYYTRNCAFEPTAPYYHGIGLTMKQIEAAFRWRKPANISTHRVNFVGGIDERNREKGLNELKILLKSIINNWPDVEFMSSADMLKLLSGQVIA